MHGGQVGDDRTPVVADDHGTRIAAEFSMQADRVDRRRRGLEATVGRHRGGGVPAQEGSDGSVSRVGEAR